jgi:adenine/guanine phosphoribosyltransferase-like PRPP-binding protein
MNIISEIEFSNKLTEILSPLKGKFSYVTGPGRSGAISAVYASHFLDIPFVPFGSFQEAKNILIIDTISQSGKTLRKANKLYTKGQSITVFGQHQNRYRFWYEFL